MDKKIKQNEQGIAHVLFFILVVIVIGGVGLVGWKVMKNHKSSNTNANNTAASTADSSCLATYHDSNLCHFASASDNFMKTAYTATLTITQGGSTSAMTLKNDGKGNTELNGSAGGQQLNTVQLNGTDYLQTGGTGPWIAYPAGSSSVASNPTSNMNIGVGATGITYKNLGTEACGSMTCHKYQITDSAAPSTTQYVWFDTSSYQLREWKYSDGSGNTTDMTVSYQAVSIMMPSPVESLSAGQ